MRYRRPTILDATTIAACVAAAGLLVVMPASAVPAAAAADAPLDGLVVSVRTNLVGPGDPRWTACPATAQGFINDDAPVTVTTLSPPANGPLTAAKSALVTQSYLSGALVGFTLILPVRTADGSTAFVHVFQEHPSRGCLPLPETGSSPAGATYAFTWSLETCNGCGAPATLATGTGCLAAHPLGAGEPILRPSQPAYKGKSQFGALDVFSFGRCDASTFPATVNPPPTVRLAGSVTGKGTLRSDIASTSLAPDLVPRVCSGACSFALTSGAAVQLTALPDKGWKVSAWSGACSGRRPTCLLTASGATSVRVTFVPAR